MTLLKYLGPASCRATHPVLLAALLRALGVPHPQHLRGRHSDAAVRTVGHFFSVQFENQTNPQPTTPYQQESIWFLLQFHFQFAGLEQSNREAMGLQSRSKQHQAALPFLLVISLTHYYY